MSLPLQRRKQAGERTVSLRSLIFSLILIPANCLWIVYIEQVYNLWWPTLVAPLSTAIFTLLLLSLGNLGLRRWAPRLALTSAELVFIYITVAVGTLFAGHSMMQLLIPMMALPERLATTNLIWAPVHRMGLLPSWLILHDKEAVETLVNGKSSLYLPGHLRAWALPGLWWIGFLTALFWVTLCLTSVLRKRWVDEEKLAFPIAQIPLAIADARATLFRQPLMWLGFSVPLLFASVNWLHQVFPAVPSLSTQLNENLPPLQPPWTWLFPEQAFGFSPFQLGLMFLMPLNMSFSLWVFHLFWCLQLLIAGFYGLESGPWIGTHPYIPQQVFGAFIGLAALLVWNSRRHLSQVLRKAVGLPSALDDSGDPLSARTAVFGGLVGLAFLAFFSHQAGLSLWLAALLFGFFFIFSLLASRLRAQLGLPVHDLGTPHFEMIGLTGSDLYGPRNLGALTSVFWFNGSFNASPVPYQMEGMKLAERTRGSARALGWGIMLATVVGITAGLWILLDVFYRKGAMNMKGFNFFMWPVQFGLLAYWVNQGTDPKLTHGLAMGVGFLCALLLGGLDIAIPGWPLHPVAYAIAGNIGLRGYAVSAFVAWSIKVLVLRYGGVKLYGRVLYVFLGFILGDIFVHGLSTIWSIIFRLPIDSGIWGM